MTLPSRPFQSLRLPTFALLSLVVLGLSVSCSKKESEAALTPARAKAAVTRVAPTKCEPGTDGKCAPSPTCSPDCKVLATNECVKCEAAGDCSIFANNCENPLLSAEDKQVCYDIQACVQSSHCFEGSKTTLGSCYCGDLNLRECLAKPFTGPDAPKGACHDLILKGMPMAKDHRVVLGNLTTRDRAAGLALSRFNCQKIGYKATCASVCGWLPPKT